LEFRRVLLRSDNVPALPAPGSPPPRRNSRKRIHGRGSRSAHFYIVQKLYYDSIPSAGLPFLQNATPVSWPLPGSPWAQAKQNMSSPAPEVFLSLLSAPPHSKALPPAVPQAPGCTGFFSRYIPARPLPCG